MVGGKVEWGLPGQEGDLIGLPQVFLDQIDFVVYDLDNSIVYF